MAKSKKKPIVKTIPTPEIVKKRMIKGAIRRVYRQSAEMKECLNRARVELPPKTLKDGSTGKKNQVRFKCAECGGLFPSKNVQVDHIDPVIDLWKSEEETDYNTIAERIWCDVDNLQVLCSTKLKDNGGVPSCHGRKSSEENFIRDRFKENKLDKLEDFHDTINNYKLEYRKYLYNKELERLAKEQRKKDREDKRKKKNEAK